MSCFSRFSVACLAACTVSLSWAGMGLQTQHWEPAGYGGSGLFPVVAVDPTPGTDVVYLGSDVAGMYKSTDGGDTWRTVNSGLVSLQIASLAIDPSNPQRLWVGTPLGLHLSENGGQSWTVVDASINSYKHVDYRGIAVSPDGQTLLVTHHDLAGEPDDGVYSGTLYRSTDAGASWAANLSFSDVAISAVVIDRHQPTNAYLLVADRGVQRSTDGGSSWHDFSDGLPQGRTWKQLDVGRAVLYVTAEPPAGSSGVGVFRSAKSSASWTSALGGLDTGEEAGSLPLADPIRISPADDQTVYLGQDAWPFNFYRTTDGGATWVGTPIDTNYEFDPVNNPQQTWGDPFQAAIDLTIDPSHPNRVFYTSWGGVMRSNDGGESFSEKIVGAQNVCSTDVMAVDGALLETNMDGGVYRSVDQGATWTSRYPTEPVPLEFWLHAWDLEAGAGGTLYFAAGTTEGAKVYHSTDDGLSWQETASGLPRTGVPSVDIFSEVSLAAHPTQPGTLYVGIDLFGVYMTTNSGQSWQEVVNLQGTNGPDEPVVKCLEVDPTNTDRIFMGQFWNGLWYSEDRGQTWTEAQAAGGESRSVLDIVALTDGRLFAAYADGLYLSRDSGHTFVRSFPDAPNLGEHELEYVEAIAVNPADANDLSVSTAKRFPVWYNRGSVWRSTDGAATWSEITGDLPIHRVRNVTYGGSHLWAATWCAAIYRTDLSATCTEPSIDGQPHSQTVESGVAATLSVAASGTAPLAHQWYRGESGDAGNPVSGATGASYTTDPLTETTSFWVRVSNACGAVDSATATITVVSDCTEPAIVAQPESQVITSGETATLNVEATGTTPLAHQWYWGESGQLDDPIEGATRASYTTYPLDETTDYWVRVSNACGSADSATATVLVTPPGESWVYLVPAVAHSPGAAGTLWRTDVAVVNPAQTEAVFAARFYPSSGAASALVTEWLSAGATVELGNILETVFGLAPSDVAAGSLMITSTAALVVSSRTYNQTPTGTYGQYLPALTVAQSLTAGQTGYLPQIKRNAAYRTNVGVVNVGTSQASIVIRLFDGAGAQVGGAKTMTVAESRWSQQFDIFNDVGAGDEDIGYATVEVETADGHVWVYASIVDNLSGDGTTIPVLVP